MTDMTKRQPGLKAMPSLPDNHQPTSAQAVIEAKMQDFESTYGSYHDLKEKNQNTTPLTTDEMWAYINLECLYDARDNL